jgi:hypothetical protein
MVVVVRGGPSVLAAVLLLIIVLIVVGLLVFLLTRGSVLVVAIPGFPVESVIMGLLVGAMLVAMKRRRMR